MDLVRERRHRLPKESYIGQIAAAFTICLENKKSFFTNGAIFKVFEKYLLEVLSQFECKAHVYLFMSDHGHFLLEGAQNNSNLYECITTFKQKTGYWFYGANVGVEWQKNFYDHILRRDEDILKQTRYILGNPERRGFARNWREYPFKGSTIYDFNQMNLL